MSPSRARPPAAVSFLRAGDWVEVRSWPEIRATLDREGRHEGLPFMPEMIRFCGQRLQVSKRAEKTCFGNAFHRVGGAVHLAGARCDGSAHDGCQLHCLTFWREEWLRRVPGPEPSTALGAASAGNSAASEGEGGLRTRADPADGPPRYVCQATALRDVTHEKLDPWDPRPYFREFRVGNAGWPEVRQLFRWSTAWARLRIFKAFAERRTTPTIERPGISVGDWVEVRPPGEILATLTRDGKNRGLRLSEDMLTFCRERFRVCGSVSRFIDETTGTMREMRSPCLVLDSAVCRGFNVLCPREQFHFWRPEWLRRVEGVGGSSGPPRSSDPAGRGPS